MCSRWDCEPRGIRSWPGTVRVRRPSGPDARFGAAGVSPDRSVGLPSGDRESLRILLVAHRELTAATTTCTNELRALLLAGDSVDRALARGRLGDGALAELYLRIDPDESAGEDLARATEIRRLAIVVSAHRVQLATNRDQLRELVDHLAPGLTTRHRIGPVRAAEIIVSSPLANDP